MSDFRIIEGLPQHVELDVRAKLRDGWCLHGEMFSRVVDGNTIVGQGVRYDDDPVDNGPSVYTYSITTFNQFDPSALINLLHCRKISNTRYGMFTYIVKIKAMLAIDAQEEILRETHLQGVNDQRSAEIEYLHMEKYIG